LTKAAVLGGVSLAPPANAGVPVSLAPKTAQGALPEDEKLKQKPPGYKRLNYSIKTSGCLKLSAFIY